MPNYSDTLRVPPSVPPPPAYADGVLVDRGRVPVEGPYLVGDRIKMIDSFGRWWMGYVPGRETCFYVAPQERGRNWKLL